MTAKIENITLFETFDATKAYMICEYYDEICELNSYKDENSAKNLRNLRRLLSASHDGINRVTYNYKKGRYYAVGPSLQLLKGIFRQTITRDFYNDLDIVNSGPSILSSLLTNLLEKYPNFFKADAVAKLKHPYLLEYVTNRDAKINFTGNVLDKFSRNSFKLGPTKDARKLTPEEMKVIYISVCNGSKANAPNEHVKNLQEEIAKNFKYICISPDYKDDYNTFKAEYNKEKGTDNVECYANFVSKLVYDIERQVIMRVRTYFGNPEDCVLTFDGIQLPKDIELNEDILEDLSEEIESDLRVEVKFKIKEMNDYLSLDFEGSENVIYNSPRILYANDYENLCGENFVTSEYVLEKWAHNSFAWIKNGRDPRIMEKQFNKCTIAKEENEEYEFKSFDKKFKDSYRRECKVYNTAYDAKFYKKYKDTGLRNPVRNDPRFNKYKYSYLCDFLDDMFTKNKFKTYDKVEFVPYLKHIKRNVPNIGRNFNIFTGFAFDTGREVKDIDVENSLWIKHIKEQLCNNEEKVYNWVLDYLADIIQNPSSLPGTCILFYSQEGTGKSLLVNFMRSLLGMKYAVSITKIDKYIETGFNSFTVAKLLKCFEEVAEEGAHKSKFGVLKGEMTSPTERLEKKQVDPIEIDNFARLIFNTNIRFPFYVDPSNRRVLLIRSSNTYANNRQYFNPIIKLLENRNYLQAVFNWLARRELKEDLKTPPVTAYEKEQKNINLPSSINMLIEYIEDNYAEQKLHAKDYKENWRVKGDYSYIVRSETLTSLFKQHFNGTATGLKKAFMQFDIPSAKITPEAGHKPTNCYLLYPPEIEKIFKQKLKDPMFEFQYPEGDGYVPGEEDEKSSEDGGGNEIVDELQDLE